MKKLSDIIHQQFDLIYLEDLDDEPKKEEKNKDYGLYVDRTFYIVSALDKGRVLDHYTAKDLTLKTMNDRKSQEFWFDQLTKTIKNRDGSNALNIESDGKSRQIKL